MSQDTTKLATLGRNLNKAAFPSVNAPVYRASTLAFSTLDEFEQADQGNHRHPGYGIYGNPTTFALCDALSEIEGADGTYLTSSGLEAVTIALLAFTKQGDHVLISDSVYSPTQDFCTKMLARFGVEVTYFAPDVGGELATEMRDNTTVVFLESPGSLTFEMQDINAIAEEAHKRNITVIGDNTWGTQLYFKPFEHGIDVSVHALTKYVGGHSDLILGSISAKNSHLPYIKQACKEIGTRVSGDDAYLALRGLRSMEVRLKQHEKSALEIAGWISEIPEVNRVLHPALPEADGHDRWKRHMSGSCGLFAIDIKPCSRDALAAMLNDLSYFDLGFSWGGFESLIIPYQPAKLRTVSAQKWEGVQCLRLNIGLEDPKDLMDDLQAGFKRMRAAS